jgi:hypothetical protein
VRTVQRFGYAFVGAVVEKAGAGGSGRADPIQESRCALLWGERIVPLPEGESVVGRDPECALRIPSGLVSRQHARFVVARGQATLEDLGSKNGTLLGGRRVQGPAPLSDGDEIRIGPALLVYCSPGSGSTRSGR